MFRVFGKRSVGCPFRTTLPSNSSVNRRQNRSRSFWIDCLPIQEPGQFAGRTKAYVEQNVLRTRAAARFMTRAVDERLEYRTPART